MDYFLFRAFILPRLIGFFFPAMAVVRALFLAVVFGLRPSGVLAFLGNFASIGSRALGARSNHL